MAFYETLDNRLRREERDRVRYPELESGSLDEIARTDARARVQGLSVTGFGQADEDISARLGFSPEEVGLIESVSAPTFGSFGTGVGGFEGLGGREAVQRTGFGAGITGEEIEAGGDRFSTPGIRAVETEVTRLRTERPDLLELGGEELLQGIAIENLLKPSTRGLGELGAEVAREEFEPDRFRSQAAIQPAVERDVGIEPIREIGRQIGRAAQEVGVTDTLAVMANGEDFINEFVNAFANLPAGLGLRDEFIDFDIRKQDFYEGSPRVVREIVQAISPLNLAAAGEGAVITEALETAAAATGRSAAARKALLGLSKLTEPFSSAGFAGRAGREIAAEVGALEGVRAAGELAEGAPAPVRFAAQAAGLFVGGVAGGLSPEIIKGARNLPIGLSVRDVGAGVDPRAARARELIDEHGILPADTERTGILLRAPTQQSLGEGYTPKQVLNADTGLQQQRTSIANSLLSARRTALDRINLDNRGRMRDLEPTEAERALGLEHPYAGDVAANPGAYPDLTPEQLRGLQDFGDTIQLVRAERELAGVEPKLIQIEDDGAFFPRSARETQGVSLRPRPGGGGSRLGGSKTEAGRVFATQAEGEAAGVVYRHPLEAANEYTNRWLKVASDSYVRDLLIPFSETSAMRVSPALRAEMEGLRSNVQSLVGSGIRLSDREDAALRAFLTSDDPDIDSLRDIIDALQITRGRNRGLNLPQANDRLTEIRAEIRQLAPEWRDALARSKQPPVGRQTIDLGIAPALSGRDFDEDVAQAITRHYGRSGGFSTGSQTARIARPIQAVNSTIRFFNATADLSAAFIQQKQTALQAPDLWAANLVRSFRDVITTREYDRLVGGETGQKWASRGLALFGDAGDVAEFQAAHWLHQIPIARQADDHFIRFNTRMRIIMAEDQAALEAKRIGRALTAGEEEQVARAINRATGVSFSRAGDFESNFEFAARFLRATIESIAHATTDGSIEGRIARRMLRNLTAVAITASVAGAVIAGRPLDEVLNPIDENAWERGELRLNSNFLSVRVFGHDVKPLGEFDSLGRLAVVGADASMRAIKERDALQLFDAFGYFAATKGSPLVGFVHDLVVGHDFDGRDPLSKESLAARVSPFSIPGTLEAIAEGKPTSEIIAGAVLEGSGLKTTPLSPSEARDEAVIQFAEERGLTGPDGEEIRGLFDMDPVDIKAFNVEHPEFAQRRAETAEERKGQDPRFERTDALNDIDDERLEAEGQLADQFARREVVGPDLRDGYDQIQRSAADKREQERDRLPFDERQRPTGDNASALFDYYEVFRTTPEVAGDLDHDEVGRRLTALEETWTEEQKEYIRVNTGLALHAPGIQGLPDTRRELREAGWYDLADDLWAQTFGQDPENQDVASMYAYRQREAGLIERALLAEGKTEARAIEESHEVARNLPIVRQFNDLLRAERLEWMQRGDRFIELANRALLWGIWGNAFADAEELIDQVLGARSTQ